MTNHAFASSERPRRVVLAGGTVVDGSGAPPARSDLAIEAGRVAELGLELDGDEVRDVSGHALLPGLIDCHVHAMFSSPDVFRLLSLPYSYRFYEAASNLRSTLAAGVTTVRDAAGADLGLKRAVADGLVSGPRMLISITMISQTGGHSDEWLLSGHCPHALFPVHPGAPAGVVDGPDAVRQRVREVVRAGADVVKVAASGGVVSPRSDPTLPHFSPAELQALVDEANAAGRAVMAHAHAADGIKNAARAGARSIEHGTFLDDEALALILEHDCWLVPTLTALPAVLLAGDAGAHLNADSHRQAQELIDTHRASIRRAVEAGVKIAMGSDAGISAHGRNPDELAQMVECGLSPVEAIRCATDSAARLLGVDQETGTLEPGKRADVLVLDGSPLDVADIPARVRAVYKDGEVVVDRESATALVH